MAAALITVVDFFVIWPGSGADGKGLRPLALTAGVEYSFAYGLCLTFAEALPVEAWTETTLVDVGVAGVDVDVAWTFGLKNDVT